MPPARVSLPMTNLRKYQNSFKNRTPAAQRVAVSWRNIYSAAMRDRYKRFSRGGGNWRGLAEATRRQRRRGSDAVSILIDKAHMFAAFQPQFVKAAIASGALGITLEFGAGAGSPDGDITMSELINAHDQGEGHLPRRVLLVRRSLAQQVKQQMGRSAVRILTGQA